MMHIKDVQCLPLEAFSIEFEDLVAELFDAVRAIFVTIPLAKAEQRFLASAERRTSSVYILRHLSSVIMSYVTMNSTEVDDVTNGRIFHIFDHQNHPAVWIFRRVPNWSNRGAYGTLSYEDIPQAPSPIPYIGPLRLKNPVSTDDPQKYKMAELCMILAAGIVRLKTIVYSRERVVTLETLDPEHLPQGVVINALVNGIKHASYPHPIGYVQQVGYASVAGVEVRMSLGEREVLPVAPFVAHRLQVTKDNYVSAGVYEQHDARVVLLYNPRRSEIFHYRIAALARCAPLPVREPFEMAKCTVLATEHYEPYVPTRENFPELLALFKRLKRNHIIHHDVRLSNLVCVAPSQHDGAKCHNTILLINFREAWYRGESDWPGDDPPMHIPYRWDLEEGTHDSTQLLYRGWTDVRMDGPSFKFDRACLVADIFSHEHPVELYDLCYTYLVQPLGHSLRLQANRYDPGSVEFLKHAYGDFYVKLADMHPTANLWVQNRQPPLSRTTAAATAASGSGKRTTIGSGSSAHTRVLRPRHR